MKFGQNLLSLTKIKILTQKQMKKTTFAILFVLLTSPSLFSQAALRQEISDTLNVIANRDVRAGNISVQNLAVNQRARTVTVTMNDNFVNFPFRPENVAEVKSAIQSLLPQSQRQFRIIVRVGNNNIEDLIPNVFREHRNIDHRRQFNHKNTHKHPPLLKNLSKPNEITHGLSNRHLAIWQSHGWHFSQAQARWEWQRPRLFQTAEDIFTQAYVLQYLVPMLENAGANVLLPRERCKQIHEVIVDNDLGINIGSQYLEHNGRFGWETGQGFGFAHTKAYLLHGENPFEMGTFRQARTTRNKEEISTIEWIPNIPESGRFGVYVSYRTVPNSVTRAVYTVHHAGGTTEFAVNQTMFGGTWLYLGSFYFDEGISENGRVVLSNYSHENNHVVTADAVRFGGGMGNIARSPSQPQPPAPAGRRLWRNIPQAIPSPDFQSEISGRPRFVEGSRYWLQWAGMPDSIYSRTRGANDGSDDFQSRGFWVNYISGGSAVSPRDRGLNVPIDLAIAFHTDAGVTINDSIIGTLAIHMSRGDTGSTNYRSGVSRLAGRDLSDIIQTQIVNDIRALHAPEWTRRGLWDRSYSEARVPEVPTMLLELLSHQNFADMRYGLDPRFKFTVGRAIYKGILRYFESVFDTELIVQPLPVEQFSIRFTGETEVELNWQPVEDPLEPTAKAKKFIVFTKIDDGAFDNGILVDRNNFRFKIEKDRIYSFKIAAVNEGGRSFASETLSVSRVSNSRGEVLIVNGFDRIGAPESFVIDTIFAGFINSVDPGMPRFANIAFTGEQYVFNRDAEWNGNDSPGFGSSRASHEAMIIAGNSFNFPLVHGRSIAEVGFSFVSSSRMAVENGCIDLNDFGIVNLILGAQRETYLGNRQAPPEFKTFPLAMQQRIEHFTQNGGNLFVSGAHIASDMHRNKNRDDIAFVENVLRIRLRTPQGATRGDVRVVQSLVREFEPSSFSFFSEPNPVFYHVHAPDAIEPISARGFTVLRYAENNFSAGIAYNTGTYRIVAFGFPFETIKCETERNRLMRSVLEFLR